VEKTRCHNLTEYSPGLRGLAVVGEKSAAGEIFQNEAGRHADELTVYPGLLCGGPGHHPRNNHPFRMEPVNKIMNIAGIKYLRSVEDQDTGMRRGGHRTIIPVLKKIG